MKDVSLKQLKKSARTIPVPFELKLHDSNKSLLCEKVIRVIPGKRIVIFGEWDNKPIVAKLFFGGRKAKKHQHRDLTGITTLINANVPTPNLVFQGTDHKKQIHILIFDRVLDSCNLDVLWETKTDLNELIPLLRAVTIELATQHVLGIIQEDLHLKNFLITAKTIYTLDGGSIKQVAGPLSKKESIEHLGLFFTQLGAGTQQLQKELFDLYADSRSWIVRPNDLELLQQTIAKWTLKRWSQYKKKIIRNCTAFSRTESLTQLTVYDREYLSDNFLQLLKNPELFMTANKDVDILKSGRSATIARVKIDQRTLIIKRYNIKNPFHWLRRCLRPSRAAKSWGFSHYLRLMGIATARPVAFIEKTFIGLRGKSYFIMEYIKGQHAGEFFSRHQVENPIYAQVANRILTLFNDMAELNLIHGDLKMTNILIQHEKPIIIDLDGMKEYKNTVLFKRAFNKEILRFMKNWEYSPGLKTLFNDLILKKAENS